LIHQLPILSEVSISPIYFQAAILRINPFLTILTGVARRLHRFFCVGSSCAETAQSLKGLRQ